MLAKESVTAVIPVWNGAHFIAEALQSVFAQTYPLQEVIVVDDGSSDDLARALRDFREKITLLRNEKSQGVSVARNQAISAARGEWIALLDYDDIWLPQKTEQQLAGAAGRSEVALVYSDMEIFGEKHLPSQLASLPTPRGRVFKQLLRANFIAPSAALVRREAMLAAGGFDAKFRNAQDRDLWLRLAARWEVEFAPGVLTRYRLHPGNLSKNRIEWAHDLFEVLLKAREYSPSEYREMWPEIRHRQSEISFEAGRLHLEKGELAAARHWFWRCAGFPDHRARALAYLTAGCLPGLAGAGLKRLKRAVIGERPYYHE